MKPNGGPAFPVGEKYETRDLAGIVTHHSKGALHSGMTLRDYFAAKAMHAELNTAGAFKGPALALAKEAAKHSRSIEQQIAVNAYTLADAMLAEREKP